MFLFSRYFFSFHQNIGRAVSRLSPFYTLLCCVHSTKGCARLRRSVANTGDGGVIRKIIMEVALFFFILAGVMVSTSTADSVSQCPADTVTIQITDDARHGSKIMLSTADLDDPHFRTLVTAVTDHVRMRLAKGNLCPVSDESRKRSLLRFVSWPLSVPKEDPSLAPVPPLATRTTDSCRLSSPWVDLAFDPGPVTSIRGVIRWNKRQLIVDQAVLAGARNIPPGVATPLQGYGKWPGTGSGYTPGEVDRFAEDYLNFSMQRLREEIQKQERMPGGEEYLKKNWRNWVRETADRIQKESEGRIPADLAWLFRRTSFSDLEGSPGSHANDAVAKLAEKSVEGYTKLVTALIDRCLAFKGINLHYNSILDVTDIISIKEYKIDSLTR